MPDLQKTSDLIVFLEAIGTDIPQFIKEIDVQSLQNACELIIKSKDKGNRLHISGIGKPAHVANYAAALFSSTGTPTYFLHGTEAVHGSCGQLMAGDVVIFISNSGETLEMKAAVNAIKDNGCKVIGISSNPGSWLGQQSDVHLYAGVRREGGPLNRAPRMSILAEMVVLQALSVLLQTNANITPNQYVKWHPGGALGKLRKDEV